MTVNELLKKEVQFINCLLDKVILKGGGDGAILMCGFLIACLS